MKLLRGSKYPRCVRCHAPAKVRYVLNIPGWTAFLVCPGCFKRMINAGLIQDTTFWRRVESQAWNIPAHRSFHKHSKKSFRLRSS